ncbi:dnaJ homolog subfamily C member 7 homolog [Littorina saxatilis]|uniref:dnaJ homolog subfamily C member 7 homolog n=1 Tax=Littorina saxatilis TaxID=31220 RepID=UPI0038B55F60
MALTLAQGGLNPYGNQGGMGGGQMGGGMGGQMGGGMGGGMFGRSPLSTLMMSRWLDINPFMAMMFGGMGGNMMMPLLFSNM